MHGLVWEWVDDFSSLLVSGDSRDQGDADKLKFCGAGALAMDGPRELRGADARGDAVVAGGARHHQQPWLSLRQGPPLRHRTMKRPRSACVLTLLSCLAAGVVEHARRIAAGAAAEGFGLPAAAAADRPAWEDLGLGAPSRPAAGGGDVL